MTVTGTGDVDRLEAATLRVLLPPVARCMTEVTSKNRSSPSTVTPKPWKASTWSSKPEPTTSSNVEVPFVHCLIPRRYATSELLPSTSDFAGMRAHAAFANVLNAADGELVRGPEPSRLPRG